MSKELVNDRQVRVSYTKNKYCAVGKSIDPLLPKINIVYIIPYLDTEERKKLMF